MRIPEVLTWSASRLRHLSEPTDIQVVGEFLLSDPYHLVKDGQDYFSGLETAWLVVLAFMFYFAIYPELDPEGLISYADLGRAVLRFKQYIASSAAEYEYPGVGPSTKYAVASTREGYLYHYIQNEDAFVKLLRLSQHLVSSLLIGSASQSEAHTAQYRSTVS